jgi:hypothetical protein
MARTYIYSTLTNDYSYTNWTRPTDPNKYPEIIAQVLVKGGANRATDKLITPLGVRTEVTDQQLEQLEVNTTFKRHKDQGLIVVMTDKEDPDDIAKMMTAKDPSAPITPNDPIFKRTDADGFSIKPKSEKVA